MSTPVSPSLEPDTDGADDSAQRADGPSVAWYRTGKGVARIGGLALVAASFGVWVYAYSGAASRPTPDLLDDPAFSPRAEEVCAAALVDLAAMPQAFDATSGADRALQVRQSTARFELMLDDLQSNVTGSDRDRQILADWLSDWRTLVADRYRYADAVAADPAAPYLVTDIGVGELMDKRVTRLANTNNMPSCAAPGDVG